MSTNALIGKPGRLASMFLASFICPQYPQNLRKGSTNKDPFENTFKERFGRTLAQNYPEAGVAFMRLARTYWSLKIVVDNAAVNPGGTVAEILLAQIERIIGPLFFPFPGPITIDPAHREKEQRKILREFGMGINVEDIIRNNPILIRDRGATKGQG